MKKIISVMLCAFMLLGMMSFGVFAEGEEVDNSIIDLTTNVATAPVIDGVVNDGEYTYTHGTVLNAETGDNLWEAIDDKGAIISVDFPYTGGFREVTWSFAADDEYLYVASTANKISGSDPQLEIMMFDSHATGPDYGRRNTIKADGSVQVGGASWVYTEATASVDNGNYVFEGKIERADLGLSKSELHVISRLWAADPESFIMFGVGAETMTIKLTPLADAEEEPVGNYSILDLAEFGQVHWTIDGKTEDAPITDGIIDPGEYTLEVKDMMPSNDEADDRFFCIDPQALDVENFNLYMSYDDDFIYIGAEVIEDEILAGERITFRFGLDNHNFEKSIGIGFVHGGAPESENAEAFATELIDGGISYEIVVKRTALTDYLGFDDNDDVKQFTLQIVMGDDRDTENYPDLWPEMWFGCAVPASFDGLASSAEAAESEGKVWGVIRGYRFPHVMTLGDAPEIDPTETEPTETEPTETEPTETAPTETTPTETTPTDTPAEESGCGSSIAAVAVALIATLGTCTVFVRKRR